MTDEATYIWNDFHKELKSYIAKVIHNKADADDVVQDVFLKIILNIDKVKNAQNMRQYLYGIVRNAIKDYFRNQLSKNNKVEISEVLLDEETKSLNTVIAERLKPFINELPEKYKEALLITEFQNISQKELAERLHLSYSGAKSRVQRGKEKLKDQLLACCAFKSDTYGNIIDIKKNKCNCS